MWNIETPKYKAIDITEIPSIVTVYRDIEKKLAYNETVEKPEFNNECYLLNKDTLIKILKLFGNSGFMARFGIMIYKEHNHKYLKVNMENSKRLKEYLKKNRLSLHKVIHNLYYGNKNNIKNTNWDIHHLCRNPNCLNPKHLIAVQHDKHIYADRLSQLLKDKKEIPHGLLEIFNKELGASLVKRIINKSSFIF